MGERRRTFKYLIWSEFQICSRLLPLVTEKIYRQLRTDSLNAAKSFTIRLNSDRPEQANVKYSIIFYEKTCRKNDNKNKTGNISRRLVSLIYKLAIQSNKEKFFSFLIGSYKKQDNNKQQAYESHH